MENKKLLKWIQKPWNNSYFIFGSGVLAFAVITACISSADLKAAIFFLLFQIGIIIMPGMAAVLILRINTKSKLELIALGYAFGYAINIISYYITVPFGLKQYLNYVLVAEGILSLYYLFFKNKHKIWNLDEDYKGNIVCLFFIVIMLVIRFVVYYGVNIIPSEGTQTFYTADLLYYIGNAVELTKGYPPMDFRWYTQPYRYHFFGSMQLAVLKMFMNTAAVTVEFCFAYLQSVLLLVFGTYCFITQLKLKFYWKLWSFISLFCVMGFESYTISTYIHHIYIAPFGFDVGFAFIMYTLTFVIIQLERDDFSWQLFIATLLMFGISVGSKAPIATVLLGALGALCAYYLFVKHDLKKGIPYAVGLLMLYLLLYFGVISQGFSTLNTERGVSLEWLMLIKDSGFGSYYLRLQEAGLPNFIVVILSIVGYLIISNPFVMIVFAAAVLIWINNIKKSQCMDAVFLSGAIIGIVLALSTNQEGKSQMYFLLAVYPFIIGFTAINLQRISWKKYKLKQIGLILLTMLLFAGMSSMLYQNKHYFKLGFSNIMKVPNPNYVPDQANLLTYDEFEAYEWIRKNTTDDAVLVSNIMLQDQHERSFITGTFTERHLWLEGWGYGYASRAESEVIAMKQVISEAIEGSESAIELFLREGVDYFIQIKRISPDTILSQKHSNMVYNNDEVIVYALK